MVILVDLTGGELAAVPTTDVREIREVAAEVLVACPSIVVVSDGEVVFQDGEATAAATLVCALSQRVHRHHHAASIAAKALYCRPVLSTTARGNDFVMVGNSCGAWLRTDAPFSVPKSSPFMHDIVHRVYSTVAFEVEVAAGTRVIASSRPCSGGRHVVCFPVGLPSIMFPNVALHHNAGLGHVPVPVPVVTVVGVLRVDAGIKLWCDAPFVMQFQPGVWLRHCGTETSLRVKQNTCLVS